MISHSSVKEFKYARTLAFNIIIRFRTGQYTTNSSNNTPSCQEFFQETGKAPVPDITITLVVIAEYNRRNYKTGEKWRAD